MTNTRPRPDQGSKPDPSEWLTAREAARFHYEHTPRTRQIHRSAVYRWVDDPDHPVQGERFGGELFIARASLEAFCRNGRPRRGRGSRPASTHAAVTTAALERIREKHGIAPDASGGEAA